MIALEPEVPPMALQRLVLVTGPSGAGRTTAIRALEDLSFEAIDNLPLSLLPRLLEGPPTGRPLAVGVDVRTRDFSVAAFLETLDMLATRSDVHTELLYLDCAPDVLLRRFSETRRRHPMAPAESPSQGVERELDLLAPIRARADRLVDTSELTLHDLRQELAESFLPEGTARLAVSVMSFSYKRGVPRGADMVFDCRFLRNPYWEPSLRALDGRTAAVAAYVEADERFAPFVERVTDLCALLLPAYRDEGKSHLAIAFGCTGGQHRSVMMSEHLARGLAAAGWQVSIRHRELDRVAITSATSGSGKAT